MHALIPKQFSKYDLKTENYDLKISIVKNIITSMSFIKDFQKQLFCESASFALKWRSHRIVDTVKRLQIILGLSFRAS